MSRDRMDIVVELVELSREIMADIKHQLNYYRASVYKHETADQIRDLIDHLRTIAALMGSELLIEPFRDYDATVANGNMKIIPGECVFSARVTSLLGSVDEQLDPFVAQVASSADGSDLKGSVQKNRHKLLKMCRQGTRQWSFFRTL